MVTVISKTLVKKAENHFSNNVPELSILIKNNGPCILFERNYNPFQSLVRSIISQQLSNKAAKTIFERLLIKIDSKNISPKNIAQFRVKDLRSIGISNSKSNYILQLAEEVLSGSLNFNSLSNLPDSEVVARLIECNGIGQWTAEMFLIFSLGRPDVMSLTDAGIIRATQKVYKLKNKPSRKKLITISNNWKPYRSIASWHLWRTLD